MNKKHKGKGHKKMYGGRTWDEYFRQNKIASTALGALSGIAGFIPGVNMLVSPALGAASAVTKIAGYGHPMKMRGGAVNRPGTINNIVTSTCLCTERSWKLTSLNI